MKLIGLAGYAGAGKDTVADYLVQQYNFEQYAFAQPIKEGLKAMFGLTDQHFNDRSLKEYPVEPYGVSPRQMAQWLGTEFGRHLIGQNVWIQAAQGRWDAMHFEIAETFDRLPAGLVVSDVRFEDEARWVRENGGEIWLIYRPNKSAVAEHISENGFDLEPNDRIIPNMKTIDDLHKTVDFIMEQMK